MDPVDFKRLPAVTSLINLRGHESIYCGLLQR
jgi:hypothetical protein